MDGVDRNGRPHWLWDDHMLLLVLRKVRFIITMRLCAAVCRKWRALAKQLTPQWVREKAWWSEQLLQYITAEENSDADMMCLRPYFRRRQTFSFDLEDYFSNALIKANRPTLFRMWIANLNSHTHEVDHERLIRMAIRHDARAVLEDALLPALVLGAKHYQTFNAMMQYAPLDLFQWYCNRYDALRSWTDYDGFRWDFMATYPDLEEKIEWMAEVREWSVWFWTNWFDRAAGTRNHKDTRHYNQTVAVLIVKHVGRQVVMGAGTCAYLRNKRLAARGRNLELHAKLLPYCECSAKTVAGTARSRGRKKAKVDREAEDGGDESYNPEWKR